MASINQDINEYYSRSVICQEGTELVQNLSELVNEACKYYLKTNKCLPETIIVYRDGVGDSQV